VYVVRYIWSLSRGQRIALGLLGCTTRAQLVDACNRALDAIRGDAVVDAFRETTSWKKGVLEQIFKWSREARSYTVVSKPPFVVREELSWFDHQLSSRPLPSWAHPLTHRPPTPDPTSPTAVQAHTAAQTRRRVAHGSFDHSPFTADGQPRYAGQTDP
jgi:hypothetical protein